MSQGDAPMPSAEPHQVPHPYYRYAELGEPARVDAGVLADECALAISYNGLNQAVMMVTPAALEDFVAGFSLSNGIIDAADGILDLHLQGEGAARQAQVEIVGRAFWALKRQRRQLPGTGSCGLCGVEALEQALPVLAPLPGAPLPPPAHLHDLRARIAEAQTLARTSGALHAALFLDGTGEVRLCREDIGRHNALDKLIGALARNAIDPRGGVVVLTSRCSLELIQTAVRAGLPTLVTLSAPTALTVQWARRHRLNLIHLPHHSAPRVYSPAPDEHECPA